MPVLLKSKSPDALHRGFILRRDLRRIESWCGRVETMQSSLESSNNWTLEHSCNNAVDNVAGASYGVWNESQGRSDRPSPGREGQLPILAGALQEGPSRACRGRYGLLPAL